MDIIDNTYLDLLLKADPPKPNVNNLKVEMREIKMGKYRHFKGGIYELLDIGVHSETEEDIAIYRKAEGGYVECSIIWVRPLKMFFEEVPKDKENPIGQKYRFEYIGG